MSSSSAELLVDTSVAVTLSIEGHEHRAATFAAVAGRRMGLAGHAAFEAFSVLTRMPPPDRREPADVARMLSTNFPHTKFLGPKAAAMLFADLRVAGIWGGSVFDALVGATALEHGLALATRDRRALPTYRALGVRVEVLA